MLVPRNRHEEDLHRRAAFVLDAGTSPAAQRSRPGTLNIREKLSLDLEDGQVSHLDELEGKRRPTLEASEKLRV
jgi:hypothetical protein